MLIVELRKSTISTLHSRTIMVSISFPLEMWKNRDAVANILNDNGFEPAPEPGLRTKWSDFFERYCEMMTTAVIRHDEKKTRNAMIEVIYASALG